MSNLLLNELPLVVLPRLAEKIGLNEAICLQQLHYWLQPERDPHVIEGVPWIYNSAQEWRKQLPFFSRPTIQRAFTALEEKGIVKVGNFNRLGIDRTKWYTIDYARFDEVCTTIAQNEQSIAQNEQSIAQNEQPLPETTTETTTEKESGAKSAPSPSRVPASVERFKEITNQWPDRSLWEAMDTTIGSSPPDIEFWGNVIRRWIGCGWRKTNIAGMLDLYEKREMPSTRPRESRVACAGPPPATASEARARQAAARELAQKMRLA